MELAATLAGVPLYARNGFVPLEEFAFPLSNGETLSMVRMGKEITVENVPIIAEVSPLR